MKKLITLSFKEKRLRKNRKVMKWLRAVEKKMNKLVTPEVLVHYSLGLPVKFHPDHIECVYPEPPVYGRTDLRKYLKKIKTFKNFKVKV